MVSSLYWISALSFGLVLLILLYNDYRISPGQKRSAADIMVGWVIFFCFQDAVWGMFASHTLYNDTLLFLTSTVFHSSTVLTTFFWLRYVLEYLKAKGKVRKVVLAVDMFIVVVQFTLLLINFFIPVTFGVENGLYVTYSWRLLLFINQYIIYLFVGGVCLLAGMREEGEKKRSHVTVFWYAFAPIATGVFQFLYPDAPFYSIGYFFSCMVSFIFIENFKKEKNLDILDSNKKVIHGLSDFFYGIFYIDLIQNKINIVKLPVYAIEVFVGISDPREMMDKMINSFVDEQHTEIMHDFNNIDQWIERLNKEQSISMEFLGKHEGWSRANIVAIQRDGNRNACELVYAVQRINEQKMREEAMQKDLRDALAMAQEASRAKTTFLSNMSHDIRTPMNAVLSYSRLALSKEKSPEKIREYLENISSAGNHLMRLINSVLDMSRIESGKMEIEEEPCEITWLIEALDTLLHGNVMEKNLNLKIDVSDVKNKDVICDGLRINQVMINLVGNAVKFTEEGGEITVALTEEPGVGKSVYHFSVKDTGQGIEEEFLGHIFEPFEREANSTISGIQGTGLGLAISKNLIEMMGGTISVRSKKGVGTEFIIDLELAHAQENRMEETEEERESVSVDLHDIRVLLVEDNKINRLIAKEILADKIKEMNEAENGRVALDLLDEHGPGYYSLILMDIQMPEMNGYETTKAIRNRSDEYKDIPIIAMTANAYEEDKRMAIEAGMNAHVTKPLDVDVLFETIGKVMSN